MKLFKNHIFKFLYFVLAFLFISNYAFALNDAEVNKEIEELTNNNNKNDLKFPSVVINDDIAKLKKSELKLYLSNIKYNYLSKPPKDIKALINNKTKDFVNKNTSISELAYFIENIESEIVKLGYPMVILTFAKQEITPNNAVININVVSGKIENIVIVGENNKKINPQIENIIKDFFQSIKKQKYLKTKDINGKLLAINKIYGLKSSMFLSRGQESSGFIINIKTLFKKNNYSFLIKNSLNESLGKYMFQGLWDNNFVLGKRINQIRLLGSTSLKRTKDFYYQGLQASYKTLNTNGSEVKFDIGTSKSGAKNSSYRTISKKNNYSLFYSIPAYVSPTEQINQSVGITNITDKFYNINTSEYQYYDKINDLSYIVNYSNKHNKQSHNLNLALHKNTGLMGAMYNGYGNVKPSRQNVTGDSFRLQINYKMFKKLQNKQSYFFNTAIQYSFNNALLSSQLFTGTGFQKVQGLIGNDIQGDSGASIFYQYNLKPFKSDNSLFEPYVSIAYALTHKEFPTSEEKEKAQAGSFSIGTYIPIKDYKINIAFNYAELKDKKKLYENSITIGLSSSF